MSDSESNISEIPESEVNRQARLNTWRWQQQNLRDKAIQNWKDKAKANELTFDDFIKTLDKKDYFKYLKYRKDKKFPYYSGMTILKQDLLNEFSPEANQLGNETLLKLKDQRTPIEQLSRKAYKKAQKKFGESMDYFNRDTDYPFHVNWEYWNERRPVDLEQDTNKLLERYFKKHPEHQQQLD